VGFLEIVPYNSRPIAANFTITVKAGDRYQGVFSEETFDPDQVGPNSDPSFCVDKQCLGDPGGPKGVFQFLTPPSDPGLTILNLTDFAGQLVGANFRGVTQGYEPFVYQVDEESSSANRLRDEIPYSVTDSSGLTSNQASPGRRRPSNQIVFTTMAQYMGFQKDQSPQP